jgi:hypothetical protein
MSRLQYYSGKFFLIFGSIVIGIPLGILLGVLYFIRVAFSFPFEMYLASFDRWTRQNTIEQADIWTKHIARMEEKSRTKQDINNN